MCSAQAHVRFGSEADSCSAATHVRFTPISNRESGHPHEFMSALPPKADMCGALAHVCFGPKADIPRFTRSPFNVWSTRRATVPKCFKRFVKLGLKERRANRRACRELKHDGYRLRTPHSPQDNNLSAQAHACIQVHNVLVVHANTSVRDEPADRSRIVRAVDGVLTASAKWQRCCTHRIRRAAARNDRREPGMVFPDPFRGVPGGAGS